MIPRGVDAPLFTSVQTLTCGWRIHESCGDRRLVQNWSFVARFHSGLKEERDLLKNMPYYCVTARPSTPPIFSLRVPLTKTSFILDCLATTQCAFRRPSCRRSLLVSQVRCQPALASRLLRERAERKAHGAVPSHPSGALKTLEPGIGRSVTAGKRFSQLGNDFRNWSPSSNRSSQADSVRVC